MHLYCLCLFVLFFCATYLISKDGTCLEEVQKVLEYGPDGIAGKAWKKMMAMGSGSRAIEVRVLLSLAPHQKFRYIRR